MAVDMFGRTSTDDDSPVCSEAELEAYTTLEIKTGREVGDGLWLLDRGATAHFTYDP